MAGVEFAAIGVRVTLADGRVAGVNELGPLLVPVTDVLKLISDGGGPVIHPRSVRQGRHHLLLAMAGTVPILWDCMCEETECPAETRHLVRGRQSGLARAFKSVLGSAQPPSATYAQDDAGSRAVFVLTAAFEAAHIFIRDGIAQRRMSGYTFETCPVRVTGTASGPVFAAGGCNDEDFIAAAVDAHHV
jgi:hypothetical protein